MSKGDTAAVLFNPSWQQTMRKETIGVARQAGRQAKPRAGNNEACHSTAHVRSSQDRPKDWNENRVLYDIFLLPVAKIHS